MSREEKNKSFMLYANCVMVKGWTRAFIYDLQKSTHIEITLAVFKLLEEAKDKTVEELLRLYKNKYDNIILQNLNFLIKEGFGFYTNAPEDFPPLDLSWCHPSIITNAIIDYSEIHSLHKAIVLLDEVGCESLQIAFSNKMNIDPILKIIHKTRIKSIEVVIKYVSNEHTENICKLVDKYPKIVRIHFYKARKFMEFNIGKRNVLVTFNKAEYYDSHLTLNAIRGSMTVDISFFTESQKYHTYYNRKLYINSNGEVKNAPECGELIGNIVKTPLQKLVKSINEEKNQRYWSLSKDKCDVCRDCEFRNMCLDTRLPYQKSDKTWFHKSECSYNPYIRKWENEEGYKTLSEVGIVSNEQVFLIDYNKLNNVNKELWG